MDKLPEGLNNNEGGREEQKELITEEEFKKRMKKIIDDVFEISIENDSSGKFLKMKDSLQEELKIGNYFGIFESFLKNQLSKNQNDLKLVIHNSKKEDKKEIKKDYTEKINELNSLLAFIENKKKRNNELVNR
ncbi:MAG: hypothetical protein ABH808_01250 [Candidatus Kuenenbacteria bacterium]